MREITKDSVVVAHPLLRKRGERIACVACDELGPAAAQRIPSVAERELAQRDPEVEKRVEQLGPPDRESLHELLARRRRPERAEQPALEGRGEEMEAHEGTEVAPHPEDCGDPAHTERGAKRPENAHRKRFFSSR